MKAVVDASEHATDVNCYEDNNNGNQGIVNAPEVTTLGDGGEKSESEKVSNKAHDGEEKEKDQGQVLEAEKEKEVVVVGVGNEEDQAESLELSSLPPPLLFSGQPVGVRISEHAWNVGKVSKVDHADDSHYNLKLEPLPVI
jgi:hypothetical protein